MTTTARTIIATITPHYSRRDIYGNCYWAFTYTDHEKDRSVSATISGGDSNIRCIPYHLNGGNYEPRNVQVNLPEELPIRQFNRMTKEWPHAGCNPEELAAWIKRNLAP